jgi:hypothetical protein
MRMKLRVGLVVLAMAAVALIAPRTGFTQPAAPITVYANGRVLTFDVPPIIIQGRVLVPLRGIFENLGATVDYNAVTQQINAVDGAQNVQLTVGSRKAWVDGVPEMLSVPAFTISGRTMVPLRFVSEGLGAQVQWIAASGTIVIASNGAVAAIPATVPFNRAPVYAPPAAQAVSGQLLAVNFGTSPSIVVRSGGQDVTVPVTAETAIYRYDAATSAGGSAALGALRNGDDVTIGMDHQGQTAKITATYRAVLGGRIAGVTGRTVTVANGQSYVVLRDAQVTLNGQSAGFEVVQPGRIARFSLVEGTNQAYEVNVTFPVSATVSVPVALSAPGISVPMDGATVGSSFVVSGQARPGAMIVVVAQPRLLGQTVQATTQADGAGAWAVTLNAHALTLVSFPYVVTATQIVDGIQSDPSSIQVTIR